MSSCTTSLTLTRILHPRTPLVDRTATLTGLLREMNTNFYQYNEQALMYWYIDIRHHTPTLDTPAARTFLQCLAVLPDMHMGQLAAITAMDIIADDPTTENYLAVYRAYLDYLREQHLTPAQTTNEFLALHGITADTVLPATIRRPLPTV